MGCCASTDKGTGHIPTSSRGGVSKSPPPSHPLGEEETVKEVLSETPKAPPLPIPNSPTKHQSPFIKSAPLLQAKPPFADDLSEASEICSTLSDSVSASTERRDRTAESRHRSPARLRNRPFSGEMHRDKMVGRSPARRSEPSPGRVRAVPGRRREGGESSGRRSRSPATRAEPGLQSLRKTGKSPGRVAPGSVEKIRKFDGGKESKWPPTHATTDESLENPLVSLECFIFL